MHNCTALNISSSGTICKLA